MAGESIEVEGLRKLNRELKAIDEALPAEVKAINREAAEDVRDAARGLVPRRSGALLGSLRTGATLRSGVVKAGTRRVPYAPPIHWGWPRRHIRPQTFLLDALDRRRDEVAKAYERNLQRLVDRVFASGTGGQ